MKTKIIKAISTALMLAMVLSIFAIQPSAAHNHVFKKASQTRQISGTKGKTHHFRRYVCACGKEKHAVIEKHAFKKASQTRQISGTKGKTHHFRRYVCVCGKEKHAVIEKHTFKNGKCTLCGAKQWL